MGRRPIPVGEHEAVAWTIHGFHSPLLTLHVKRKHVLLRMGVGRIGTDKLNDRKHASRSELHPDWK